MLVPTGLSAAPGSSYRMVSPQRSHHHFATRRPARQPAAVYFARTALMMPWSPAVRLGLGITEDRAKYCMSWGTMKCSATEVDDARALLYPATTASGQLVSQQAIAAGQYTVSDEGTATPAFSSGGGSCGLKPTMPPMPPLIPAENCVVSLLAPPDYQCVQDNAARQQHNNALRRNRNQEYNRALCEFDSCRNQDSRNCAAEFPYESVPSAPGTAVQVAPDSVGIYRPVSGAAATGNGAAGAAATGDGAGGGAAAGNGAGGAVATGNGAGGTAAGGSFIESIVPAGAASWFTGSMVGGLPNWLLIVAAGGVAVWAMKGK